MLPSQPTDQPHLILPKVFLILCLALLSIGLLWFADYISLIHQQIIARAIQDQAEQRIFEEELSYQLHLAEIEKKSLTQERERVSEEYGNLKQEYENLKSDESIHKLNRIEKIFQEYQETLDLVERNQKLDLDIEPIKTRFNDWGNMFIQQKFDELETELMDTHQSLDEQYQQYLASLPTPMPKPVPVAVAPAAGYTYQTVTTSRGSFPVHLIKMNLNEVTVKTVTANSDNCSNNCPAQPLANYIAENNAYAGLHGTYFCPPDYASCANKTYSYDFGVYNSNLGKWLNDHALKWNNLGLLTFNQNQPRFYRESKGYAGESVTAGMSNFPSLLENGNVVVDENSLTSYQRDVRGPRGAIAVDDQHVYLAIVSSATVPDTAYVMQSLGAKHALNLDGGGSSAMFINGNYKIGPGRALPNAILLVK